MTIFFQIKNKLLNEKLKQKKSTTKNLKKLFKNNKNPQIKAKN